MEIRFYMDPETELPHIYRHGVDEQEVEEVLCRPLEDRPGSRGSRVAVGKTDAGRYLRVIFVPDDGADSVFVVTAYPIGWNVLRALRRRLKPGRR